MRQQIFKLLSHVMLLAVIVQACKPGCSYCDASQNTCYSCSDPTFELINDGTCANAPQAITNCYLYSTNFACARCSITYQLNGTTCLKDQTGCKIYSSNGQCQECGFGTLLNGSSCNGILNCDTYVSQGRSSCQTCANGFMAFDTTCYVVEGCADVMDNGGCRSCSDGYTLSGYSCIKGTPNITGCAVLTPMQTCLYCLDGYSLNGTLCTGGQQGGTTSVTTQTNSNGNSGLLVIGSTGYSQQFTSGGNSGSGGFGSSGAPLVVTPQGTSVISPTINTSSLPQSIPSVQSSVPIQTSTITTVTTSTTTTTANCNITDDTTGRCIRCTYGFYFDPNSNCITVSPLCQGYNLQNGNCLGCIDGYTLQNNGTCLQNVQIDPNCNIPSSTGCISCKYNFYLSAGVCNPVSPLCYGYDLTNGQCLDCVQGYTLSNGACITSGGSRQPQSPPQQTVQQSSQSVQLSNVSSYSNCINIGSNGCTICTQGFTVINGYCKPLQQFCQSADQTGNCISCVQGYILANGGTCVSNGSITNCQVVNGTGCQQCFSGYWLNRNTCQAVNTQCATFNSANGFCTSCYNGYNLNQSNGQCVQTLNQDRNCQQFDSNSSCIKCFASYFLNPSGVCTLQNNLCATFNQNTGECTSCYQGYTLANGNCSIRISDPNCKSFNSDNSCKECSTSFYLRSGKCVRFNALCATINATTGDCTSCYNGYMLKQGNCSIGTSVTVANCRTIQNGVCVTCSVGYFRTSNNICQQISPLCATADQQTGLCLSCYNGYQLRSGVCSLSQSIANCRQVSNSLCIICSAGYFLQNGGCTQISPLCATSDNTIGNCLSCYQGYVLSGGSCVVNQNNNCRQFNNNVCVQCAQGYMMINGTCVVINPLCRTVDPTSGSCITCYSGYILQSGNCIIPQNNDPNCVQKSGSTCLYCQNGYWINNNVCTALSKKCQNYDQQTGNCISCGVSLQLVNGDCIGSPSSTDPNCIIADETGQCTNCTSGYYLAQGVCTAVSFLCVNFDFNRNMCTSCQQGYFLQDGDCIFPSLGYDQYCTRYINSFCSSCQQNYYLNNYVCTAIDSNCTQFDSNAGVCRVCQIGQPQGAVCVN